MRVVALCLALCASPTFAQDLSFEFQEETTPTRDSYGRMPHFSGLVRSGDLSIVRAAGGAVATPSGPIGISAQTLLVNRHDASGRVRSMTPLMLGAQRLRGDAEPLPDGGMLVFARVDQAAGESHAAIIRFDPQGREMWRNRMSTRGVSSCNHAQSLCAFVALTRAVHEGSQLWVSGYFKRGTLQTDNARIRGRRYMNQFLLKLDLDTGALVWTRSGGGGDDNLAKQGDALVYWEKQRDQHWIQHVSADTGRRLHRVPLQASGSIQNFVAHGDGYAGLVETHIAAEHRNIAHIVGWDALGRERFRHNADLFGKIRSYGDILLVTDAEPTSLRTVGVVGEGVRITALDTSGRSTRTADFGGWWFPSSLQPSLRDGHIHLSGVLADGERYVITSLREGVYIPSGTAPGTERTVRRGPTTSVGEQPFL